MSKSRGKIAYAANYQALEKKIPAFERKIAQELRQGYTDKLEIE